MLVAALVFGWKAGAIAGSFGMALFDLTSGWLLWSPFTFVIVGLMGLVVGMFAEKKPIKNYVLNAIVAILLAIGIKVGGYYIAECILYGNWDCSCWINSRKYYSGFSCSRYCNPCCTYFKKSFKILRVR